MVNRAEFTNKIVGLLSEMIAAGEKPFGDTWKRTPAEQLDLWSKGRKIVNGIWVVDDESKIVTMLQVSTTGHAIGKAIDIYFLKDDGTVDYGCDEKYAKWHKIWEEKYGGVPLIVFKNGSKDNSHFEGK